MRPACWPRVADLVRCQHRPWRGADGKPPVGSRIIRAANAFDDLVGSSAESSRSAAALERLRLDTATEYDPVVVEALARVAGSGRCPPVGCPRAEIGARGEPW